MKKLFIISIMMALFLFVVTAPAMGDGQIIISITGSCKSVGVSNVLEADVILNGKLYKSKVTGIGIYVPVGSHQVQVNGYCYDVKKKVARDIGVWRKNVKIKKNGQIKKYTAKFK